jgi:hypothetical protein
MARVNDPQNAKNKEFKGDHSVTITTGPSYESQREEAADFSDTLVQVPGVFPLIGDLLVRMRSLGPIGEQIAERLTPPQFANQAGGPEVPASAKAAMSQMQQQIQQMTAVITQLQQEKAAKMTEKSVALQQTALQENTKLVIAQMQLQAQSAETMLQAEVERIQGIMSDSQEHQMLHHQSQTNQADAAHAQSIAPAPVPGQNGGGGTQ